MGIAKRPDVEKGPGPSVVEDGDEAPAYASVSELGAIMSCLGVWAEPGAADGWCGK